MNVVVQLFRLSPSSWAALGPIGLPRAALTAVGAWTLLAWGRLGLQAFTAPRATVRFVLIGAYAWLALAALVWLVVVLAERLATSVDPAPAPAPTIDGLLRITEVVGSAHRPLVFLGIAIQLLQLVNLLGGPGAVFAAVTMAWMAATLGAAVAWAARRPLLVGLAVTVLPFALWLATAGRFGLNRVGHLL